MHAKNRVPEEFITLKEERTVTREQDQVAETFLKLLLHIYNKEFNFA